MRLISWNVNGLRAAVKKGFMDSFNALDADIFCLQETKLQPEQAVFDLEGYHRYFHSADKKGYSGTAVLTRTEPLSVCYDFGGDEYRHEGRVITAEYPDFYLVCCYTPNSQDGLKRLPYRMQWEDDLRAYLLSLDAVKPVVYCGDLNVAHAEIDLKNPKTPTPRGPTAGGATASTRGRRTRAGASTISSSPSGWLRASRTRASAPTSTAATTAPSCWSLLKPFMILKKRGN